MQLTCLSLQNFRNYEELCLSWDPGLNLILGKNGEGKTSLLEAIYLLATARSWKAGRDSEMIRWGADRSRVSGRVARERQNDVDIEIILSRSEKKHVAVNTIRQARLASFLGRVNVVLIEPHDTNVVRGEPSERRKFLNLEISQLQPQYCHLLVGYRRVLEQRNRLLKEMDRKYAGDGVLGVLDEQLVRYGSRILERRLRFVRQIGEKAVELHSRVTDEKEVLALRYESSIDLGRDESADGLAQAFDRSLKQVRGEEIRRRMTLVGPQRDDLLFTVNGVDARVYGSQGQQRTIALSLRLAELLLMEETAGEPPIVLLDDVMTDLDEERRSHVFAMTRDRCQTFLTAVSAKVFDAEFIAGAKVFHVTEGRVTAA
jgi:DNA replication and repair protein RecF